MTGWARRHGPLVMTLMVFGAAVAGALVRALARTGGHLTYALDDPYIHMALAKNLAAHGVWGVTPYEFTAASSSPLWTGVLALVFRLTGPREILPFLLCIVGAVAVLGVAHEALLRRGLDPVLRSVTLLAIVFLTPLPTLLFSGLEHTFHLLLTLVFGLLLVRVIDGEPGRRPPAALLIVAVLLGAIRYEALFTVLAGCVLFAVAGRWRTAVLVGLAACAGPLAFGMYSLAHGGELLPNSVLLKGNAPHLASLKGLLSGFGLHAVRVLIATPHLLALGELLLGSIVARRFTHRGPLDGTDALPLLVLGGVLLHLQFAQTGWFFRYEAYLMGAGVFAFAWALPAILRAPRGADPARHSPVREVGAWLLVALVAAPMASRAVSAYRQIPTAAMNVYEQQVQMAAFVHEAYGGQGIALNDIGAVTFFSDIHCLDLVGLANLEVLRAKRAGRADSRFLEGMAERSRSRIAIVYDRWFETYVPGGVPRAWTRVGLWRFRDNIACYSDSVSFYAVRSDEVAPLVEHLRAFAPRLPVNVAQSGAYVMPAARER